MHRLRQLRLPLLLAASLCAASLAASAESGFLVVHVKDNQERPIAGLQIGVKGDGGAATTGTDGKARIKLAKDTKENDWVSLQILHSPPGKDFMMVSPWDYATLVPSFANESKNFVEITVVQRGDLEALKSGTVLKSLTEQINKANAPKSADKQAQPEDPKANLAAVARQYGLAPDELDQAIRAWGAKATDPYQVGLAALYERDYPTASAQLTNSLKQREEKLTADQKAVADAALFLGQSKFEEGRFRESASAFSRCLELRPNDLDVMGDLGVSLTAAGKLAEAEPLLRRVLSELQEPTEHRQADVAGAMNALAMLLHAKGENAEAESLLKSALEIANTTLGPEDPLTESVTNNLAMILKTKGTKESYAEAEKMYRRVLASDEKEPGPGGINLANSDFNLGKLLVAEGNYSEGVPRLERALEIVKNGLPVNHPLVAGCSTALADAEVGQRNFTKAEGLYRSALESIEKSPDSDLPDLAYCLHQLAATLVYEGKYLEAEQLARRCLAIKRKTLQPDDPRLADELNDLAGLLKLEKNYIEADPLFREALGIYEKGLNAEKAEAVRRSLRTLAEQRPANEGK